MLQIRLAATPVQNHRITDQIPRDPTRLRSTNIQRPFSCREQEERLLTSCQNERRLLPDPRLNRWSCCGVSYLITAQSGGGGRILVLLLSEATRSPRESPHIKRAGLKALFVWCGCFQSLFVCCDFSIRNLSSNEEDSILSFLLSSSLLKVSNFVFLPAVQVLKC